MVKMIIKVSMVDSTCGMIKVIIKEHTYNQTNTNNINKT
jgi:hypothetical protein